MTSSQPTASASPVSVSVSVAIALARGGGTSPARTPRPGLAGLPGLAGPRGGWARAFLREGL